MSQISLDNSRFCRRRPKQVSESSALSGRKHPFTYPLHGFTPENRPASGCRYLCSIPFHQPDNVMQLRILAFLLLLQSLAACQQDSSRHQPPSRPRRRQRPRRSPRRPTRGLGRTHARASGSCACRARRDAWEATATGRTEPARLAGPSVLTSLAACQRASTPKAQHSPGAHVRERHRRWSGS